MNIIVVFEDPATKQCQEGKPYPYASILDVQCLCGSPVHPILGAWCTRCGAKVVDVREEGFGTRSICTDPASRSGMPATKLDDVPAKPFCSRTQVPTSSLVAIQMPRTECVKELSIEKSRLEGAHPPRAKQNGGGLLAMTDDGRLETTYDDRRKRKRLPLHWPVNVFRHPGMQSVEGQTENLTSEGFYWISKVEFQLGECLRCVIAIPAAGFPYSDLPVLLKCHVTVKRLEASPSGFGLGCHIEDYGLLASFKVTSHELTM